MVKFASTRNFNPLKDTRMLCSCGCNSGSVNQQLLDKLQIVRNKFGKGMIVTSGYRCATHNLKIGGASKSQHLTGNAIDISCTNSSDRAVLVRLGLEQGLTVGVRKDIIHFDNRTQQLLFLY